MFFQRLDLASEMLKKLDSRIAKTPGTDTVRVNQLRAEKDKLLNDNLMAALTNNEPDFVRLYLENGAKVSSLQPTTENPERPKTIHRSRSRQRDKDQEILELPAWARAVGELYLRAANGEYSHVAQMVNNSKYNKKSKTFKGVQHHKDLTLDGHLPYNVVHMERLMQDLVGGNFSIKRNWAALKEPAPDAAVAAAASRRRRTSVAEVRSAKVNEEERRHRERQREAAANHMLMASQGANRGG